MSNYQIEGKDYDFIYQIADDYNLELLTVYNRTRPNNDYTDWISKPLDKQDNKYE